MVVWSSEQIRFVNDHIETPPTNIIKAMPGHHHPIQCIYQMKYKIRHEGFENILNNALAREKLEEMMDKPDENGKIRLRNRGVVCNIIKDLLKTNGEMKTRELAELILKMDVCGELLHKISWKYLGAWMKQRHDMFCYDPATYKWSLKKD